MPHSGIFVLIIGCILMQYTPACKAGDTITTAQQVVVELSDVTPRIPGKSFFDTYWKDKNYQYGGEYKPPPRKGLLYRIWKYILNIIARGVQVIQYLPLILRIALLIACLVMLYIIATKTRLYKLFYSDRELSKPDVVAIDPMEHEFDFDKALEVELIHHHYRQAIRLLHLKLLKELNHWGIIRLSKDKTNREYTCEISDIELRNAFVGLTAIYNRVWYGKYLLSGTEYESLAQHFHQFTKTLHAGQK